LLEALAPGESHTFDAELTKLQRMVVQELAAELRLVAEVQGKGENALLQVRRRLPNETGTRRASQSPVPEGTQDGPSDADAAAAELEELAHLRELQAARDAEAARKKAEEDLWAEEQGSTANLMSKLFYKYATGSYNGERIFLRFPDLRKFAEDAKSMAPESHRMFCQFEGVLESTFEDTIQLQSDMGTKTTKGLTLRWFQVFVQKSLTRLGLQIVSLLMALLSHKKG